MIYQIAKSNRQIIGNIQLDGSKSISNRALIIRALCPEHFAVDRLSTSKDTTTLEQLLATKAPVYDAGAAGTTFRFMTAYLALQSGTQTLTGSERMKQRPIGVLVEALKVLGANITYLEKEGYPPLQIGEGDLTKTNQLTIPAGISSQFISALLMIAPILPEGLNLQLEGKIVSRPYIDMTLSLMKYFGVTHTWEEQTIIIPPQTYRPRSFTVEADWSAASYYYAMAAFADELDLALGGLFENSLQGDSVLAEMMVHFGVATTFEHDGLRLTKLKGTPRGNFSWNFIKCPDIAQTVAVVCGGLGVSGSFSGLETLKIKETDRVMALHQELAKVGVAFREMPAKNGVSCKVNGKAAVESPIFATYEDHRMAMAFAPLAMLGDIQIEEPMVVVKSYPRFYEDMEKLGFLVKQEL